MKYLACLIFLLISGAADAAYYCGTNDIHFESLIACNANCEDACTELSYSAGANACPSGYSSFIYDRQSGTTYGVSLNQQTWSANQQFIAGNEHKAEIVSILANLSGKSLWLGLYDTAMSTAYGTVNKSNYAWTDGLAVTYDNFAAGQPDNKIDGADIGTVTIYGEHWAYADTDGKWYDDGQHASYGGDYQPRHYGIGAFNGMLDCVAGLPPQEQTDTNEIINTYCSDSTSSCMLCIAGDNVSQCLSASSGGYVCPSDMVSCDSIYENPLCPDGGILNGLTDMCQKEPIVTCENGFSYDYTSDRCYDPPECPNGGVLNPQTDQCEVVITDGSCPTGYTYDSLNNSCVKTPDCSAGTYIQANDRCEFSVTYSCPTGYSYNSSTGKCEDAPDCPTGFTYSTTSDKCLKTAITSCPTGYTLSNGQCIASPTCPSGTSFSTTTNRCESAAPYVCSLTSNSYSSLSSCQSACSGGETEPTLGTSSTNQIQFAGSEYVRLNLSGLYFSDFFSSWIPLNGVHSESLDRTYQGFLGGSGRIKATISTNNYKIKIDYEFRSYNQDGSEFGGYFQNSGWIDLKAPLIPGGIFGCYYDTMYRTYSSSDSWGYYECGKYDGPYYKNNTQFFAYCGEGTQLTPYATSCGAVRQARQKDGWVANADIYPNPNAELTCPDGYVLSGTKCIQNGSCSAGSCPSGTSLSGGLCIANPTCPGGGTFNSTTDKCVIPLDYNCPVGSAYDATLGKCVAAPSCNSSGILNIATDKCTLTVSTSCPSGYTQDGNICYSAPVCSSGIYNSTLNECTLSASTLCPIGYTFNADKDRCEKSLSCPSGSIYSTQLNWCVYEPEHDCGGSYAYSPISRQCEAVPICTDSIYNPAIDKCHSGSCPYSGNECVNLSTITGSPDYKCSPHQCLDPNDPSYLDTSEDTQEGANDKLNDGNKDDSGQCLDQIYIFNGGDRRCRPPGTQTGFSDCCKKDETWFGLGKCSSGEQALSALRNWGELDGQCHYVGEYCAEKWGICPACVCVQKKKTYCCFGSPLGRIIAEQGRDQLGFNFGTAKSPNCRGFTPDEFQKLDFSKINFSEWLNTFVNPEMMPNVEGTIINTFENIQLPEAVQ